MGFRKWSAGTPPEEVLFDSSTIDLVALSSDGTQVELHIVADAPWTGSDAQIRSLQEKIHTYVGFAADGQLAAAHPEAEGHPWAIVITSHVGAPDERTADVLARTADPVTDYGGRLVVRT